MLGWWVTECLSPRLCTPFSVFLGNLCHKPILNHVIPLSPSVTVVHPLFLCLSLFIGASCSTSRHPHLHSKFLYITAFSLYLIWRGWNMGMNGHFHFSPNQPQGCAKPNPMPLQVKRLLLVAKWEAVKHSNFYIVSIIYLQHVQETYK